MKTFTKLSLVLFLASTAFAQLQSMQGVATGTLVNYPLGSQTWALGFENLPTTTSGSIRPLIVINLSGSPVIECQINANELSLSCYDTTDSFIGQSVPPKTYFTGMTDTRVVFTRFKDPTYGETRMDQWAGDCSNHSYSVQETNQGSEPSTTSGTYRIGDTSAKVRFARMGPYTANSVFSTPACPADAPTVSPSAYMDYRFDGASPTNVDSTGNQQTLSGTVGYSTSMTYNPSCSIISSANPVMGLNVFSVQPFTLTSTSIIHLGNGVPVSYSWTKTSGPSVTITSPSASSTLVMPTVDGSYNFQLAVGDGTNITNCTINVGHVASDINGNRLPSSNTLLETMIGPGPIAKYASSAYSWAENVERQNVDILGPYWQAPPAPATLWNGSGSNDMIFSGRGPFTGVLSDSYDVKISATGSPDSYQWRKNGGSWSASIPIVLEHHPCYGSLHPPAVTDGVIACFNSATGHAGTEVWTRMAPQVGTGLISHTTSGNSADNWGGVCGAPMGTCDGSGPVVVGTGTTWKNGDAAHQLILNTLYYVKWDANNDGTWAGAFVAPIKSVIDDTHVVIGGSAGSWPIPESLSTTVKFQMVGLSDDRTLYTGFPQPNGSLIYYDAILGAVRFALATNLDIYINYATAACNNWWVYGVDHGYRLPDTREFGYQSMMACAAFLGTTASWVGTYPSTSGSKTSGSGLDYALSYYETHGGSSVSTNQPRDSSTWVVGDVRGNSYYVGGQALMIYADPTNKNTWCNEVKANVTNWWLLPWVGSLGRWTVINGGQDGYVQENLVTGTGIPYPASGTPSGPASSSVIYGTSGWRDVGLPADKFVYIYNAFNDTSSAGCNDQAFAATVKTAAIQMANFLWDYGRSADGGQNYNVLYATPQAAASPTSWNIWNISGSGTGATTLTAGVPGVSSSTTLTSADPARTRFTKLFASGNGTPHITLNGGGAIQIDAVIDDGTLTLHTAQSIQTSTYAGTGTVTVTNGSPTITFTNVNASALLAPCDGTTYFTVAAAGGNAAVYNIVNGSCTTTQATLNVNYADTTNTTADFALVVQASTNCLPSLAPNCEPNAAGSGVSLAHDWAVALGQTFLWTGDPIWYSRLQFALGHLYGGPAAGAEYIGAPAGPQASGLPSNFMQNIFACNENNFQGPCTNYAALGGEFVLNQAKPYGMSAGAGNMRNALAIANMLSTAPSARNAANSRIFGGAR